MEDENICNEIEQDTYKMSEQMNAVPFHGFEELYLGFVEVSEWLAAMRNLNKRWPNNKFRGRLDSVEKNINFKGDENGR